MSETTFAVLANKVVKILMRQNLELKDKCLDKSKSSEINKKEFNELEKMGLPDSMINLETLSMIILDHTQNLLKKEKKGTENKLDETKSYLSLEASDLEEMDTAENNDKLKSMFDDLFGETPTKMSPIQQMSLIQSMKPLSLKVSFPIEVAKQVLYVQQPIDSKDGRPIETITSEKIIQNCIPKCLNCDMKGYCVTECPQRLKLCPYFGKFAHQNECWTLLK